MARSHIFYTTLSVPDLQRLVEDYQTEFDTLLGDTLSEEELLRHEKLIDAIGSLYAQPLLQELTFDDLSPAEGEEEKQRLFFERVRSQLVIENLPYFESNPFQVSYLIDLIWSFDEVLVDEGGMRQLKFRKDYLDELRRFKKMDSLIQDEVVVPLEITSKAPVHPIDFLILDVYKELERLEKLGLSKKVEEKIPDLPEKTVKAYRAMGGDRQDATSLLLRSGLIAKDLDDHLEKLKFWLRKFPYE